MRILILAILVFASVACSPASLVKSPDCSRIDSWATKMAFVHLKNSGITNNESLDFSKTKISLVASEKIDRDLYRQVHLIIFTEKTGNTIEVITVNNASNEECSMSGVQVLLIKKQLGEKTIEK